MKIIAGIIFTFVFLFSLGFAAIIVVGYIIPKQTTAENYSPLDFSDGLDKFEVKVGTDRINGRYFTYHYEFKD